MARQKDKNEMTADELLNKVKQLFGEKKYNDIINLLDETILTKTKDARLFNELSQAYYKKGDNYTAIRYVNKACEIAPNNALYYYNRGNLWSRVDKYENAIEDYTSAIKLRDNVDFYNQRGIAYARLRKYEDSIQDFTKCIEFKIEARYYYNRGLSKGHLGDYEDAIRDFSNAIALKQDARYYYNRGVSWHRKGEYKSALNDYEKAIELDSNYTLAKNSLTNLKTLLGEEIDSDDLDTGNTLQLFKNVLNEANATDERQKIILKICAETKLEAIDKIRAHAAKNIDTLIKGKGVVHYTKLFVADIFAMSKESPLRYYNSAYMNDPEEGIVLLEHMGAAVKKSYRNASIQEEDNIYIGSFLPADSHEDELVMWRTYGKDEKQVDGGGCSIIINQSFFDPFNEENGYLNPEMVSDGTPVSTDKTTQCLYRVLYYNKNYKKRGKPMIVDDKSKAIEKDIITLNGKLLELTQLKERNPNSKLNTAIDKIIYHLLSEIRFFFKSADYAFENEIRVLQFAAKNSPLLNIDDKSYPKKVYIESNKPVQGFIEKIILGPKVPNHKQWLYLDVAMKKNNPKKNVSVEVSVCKYQ